MLGNISPVSKLSAARRTAVLHLVANVFFTQVSPDVNERNCLSANQTDVSSVTHSDMSVHHFGQRRVLKT